MSAPKNITLHLTNHRMQEVVRLCFVYDVELIEVAKQISHCKWSKTMAYWYIPKIYKSYMRDFVVMFRKQKLSEVSNEQINHYILRLIRKKNISESQQSQRINAIKFYYEKVFQWCGVAQRNECKNSSNPLTVSGRQEAFLRIYGKDMKKTGALNTAYLNVKIIN